MANNRPYKYFDMAKLINNVTKKEIDVRVSYDHPACSYGRAVWVDKNNEAYTQVDMPTPLYTIIPDEQDERERIGREISELRKASGLSQAELGERIGCDRSYIAKIENGRQHISINVLFKITTELGARVEIIKHGNM